MSLKTIDSLQNKKAIVRKDNCKPAKIDRKFISAIINRNSINIKLNLQDKSRISPYIIDFAESYAVLDWLVNYLEQVLNISCLFFCKLKINKESKEITIYNEKLLNIVYKYQNTFLTSTELDKENKKYIDKGLICYWFFGEEADNKTSENWSFQRYGKYRYFLIDDNYIAIEARELLPNNSVGIPLDFNDEGMMIRKTLFK